MGERTSAKTENPPDAVGIERVVISNVAALGVGARRTPQSAASAAFSVVLGRMATEALASSGR
jgi:hypothetical protein